MDKHYNITFHGKRFVDEWRNFKKTGRLIEENFLPNIHFQCLPDEWCKAVALLHPTVTGWDYEEVKPITMAQQQIQMD